MAIQLDDLVARLRLDTAGMEKSVRSIDSSLDRVSTNTGRMGGSVAKSLLKVTAGLAVGAKAISFVGDSLSEGREAEKIAALTEQRIKTMGNVAGISAKGVGKLSEAISRKAGIDDEAVQSGANLLLSFSKVSNVGKGMNAVFDRATRAAVDLSAGGFGSIDGASKQLGKALQDPVKGIAALSRSGVTFTEQQQKTIKSMVEHNNILGAQKIILGEVEKQVKGSAAAQATASDKAKVAYANLQEQIGVALIPTVDKLASIATNKVIPAISGFVTGMQDGTGAGGKFKEILDRVWSALQTAAGALSSTVGFLRQHETATKTAVVALTALWVITKLHGAAMALQAAGGMVQYLKNTRLISAATRTWAAVQWLMNAALTANPIGLTVAALALLAVGLVILWKKSDTFREVVTTNLERVAAIFRWLWNEAVQPVVKFLLNGLASVIDMFANLLDALSGVPGFGWADNAAAKMHNAADSTRELADGIRDIPDKDVHVNVIVNTSAIDKAQAQLDRFQAAAASPRRAGGTETADAVVQRFNLPGIMRGLIDGIERSLGPIESDVDADIADLMDRIASEYEGRGEAAATRVEKRFKRIRARLTKALTEAEKTKGKKDDKAAQANLDELDEREEKAIKRAIARYRKKARAAQAAAREITVGLAANARAQDELNEKLDVARSNLEALQEQARSFAQSVADAFTDYSNVVGLGLREIGDTTVVTTQGIIDDLAKRLADASHFARLIGQLTASGLNQTTINQLLAAGVENGLATAEAIAAGGAGAISQINDMTGQLTALGTQLGESLASTFYGTGIQAAQSVVDGLVIDMGTLTTAAAKMRTDLATVLGSETKRGGKEAGEEGVRGIVEGLNDPDDKIGKSMRRIARQMIRSLRDELDMHSPSRKLRALGELGGSSVAMGLDASLPDVEHAVRRLADAATFDPARMAVSARGVGALGTRSGLTGALSAATVSPVFHVYVGNEELDSRTVQVVGSVLDPLRRMTRQGAIN